MNTLISSKFWLARRCLFNFGLLFLFSVSDAYSESLPRKQKIVALISLGQQEISKYSFYPGLDQEFRNRFSETQYDIEIIQYANQSHLWNALHDPRNVAVFWLSHSLFQSHQQVIFKGARNSIGIIDSEGFDVTPAFWKMHPNMKVLAIISCYSSQVVSHWEGPRELSGSRLILFDKEIVAREVLRSAIQSAKAELKKPEIRNGYHHPERFPIMSGYRIEIKRTFSSRAVESIYPAVRVMANKEIVGVFPKWDSSDENNSQTLQLFVPDRNMNRLPDILIESGNNIRWDIDDFERMDLGNFQIDLLKDGLHMENCWKPSVHLHGKMINQPIGIFERRFLAAPSCSDSGPVNNSLVEDSEFLNEAMPPCLSEIKMPENCGFNWRWPFVCY